MYEGIGHCPDPVAWLARIAAHITPEGDCWRWTGALDQHGYGRFRFRGPERRHETNAHRASWLAHRGDIPPELVVDHLCRNRACVNPWHLDIVTTQVNVQRGDHSKKRGRRGRPVGYVLACGTHGRSDGCEIPAGIYGRKRWRCRICAKAAKARWKARQA
jgi:hypothetical protein